MVDRVLFMHDQIFVGMFSGMDLFRLESLVTQVFACLMFSKSFFSSNLDVLVPCLWQI